MCRPDKGLTWVQVVQPAKKVQVEKNGAVEAWGFAFQQYDRPYQLLPLLQSNGAAALSPDGKTKYAPHPQMAQALRRASAASAALGACP